MIIWTNSTCSYCGMGCGLEIGFKEGIIVSIIINSVYDIHSKQPGYKFTAINFKKIEVDIGGFD
jgi:anaerobic selenocysteine-containing dehydrogenase